MSTIKHSSGRLLDSLLMCPVCKAALVQSESGFECENRHSFDRAKEGYINLLLANQKSSKTPGDSAEMLMARREFLDAGYYRPVAEGIADCISDLLMGEGCIGKEFISEELVDEETLSKNKTYSLLDCGCGEGYYLNQLLKKIEGQWITTGLDIAKAGVRLAAKRYKDSHWVCASSENLPFLDSSLDMLLRVFAPGNDSEVHRVLNESGIFINVTPGEEHLIDIKKVLYDEIKPYGIPELPKGFMVANLKNNSQKVAENKSIKKVKYKIDLNNNASIRQLLSMTPFLWRGKREAREELKEKNALSVTIDMDIHCYRKV